jgi:hypothetical protein
MFLAPRKMRTAARPSNFRPNLETLEEIVCPTALSMAAQDDAFSVSHGKAIQAMNLCANDVTPATEASTVEIVSYPTKGYLYSDPFSGKWTYWAPYSEAGLATFEYRLVNGSEVSNVATVTIQIENSAPMISPTNFSVLHGRSTAIDLNGMVSDVDGDWTSITILQQPSHGSLWFDSWSGKYQYSSYSDFVGTDSFVFQASDGIVSTIPATVLVSVTDQAPTTSPPPLLHVLHGHSAQIDLSSLISDADGDSSSIQIVQQPEHGWLWFDSWTGTYQYSANWNHAGTDVFAFKANDGALDSAVATVTIQVENQAPVALAPSISVVHGRAVDVNLASFARDPDGDYLTVAIARQPEHGWLYFNSWSGTYQYSANFGYSGADSFAFVVCDGVSQSEVVQVPIIVTNIVPEVATPEQRTVLHGRSIPIDLRPYASDGDSDWLSIQLVTQPQHGWVWFDSWTGSYQYSADSNYVGEDGFAFKANDGASDSNIAVVPILVANSAPVASIPAAPSVRHGGSVELNLQDYATDADADWCSITITQQPAHGRIWFNAWSGRYVYSANYGYAGADSFAFAASDGASQSDNAIVNIAVTNNAPVALPPASMDLLHGGSIIVDLRSYVSDSDGDWPQIVITQQPSHGWIYFDTWSGIYRYYAEASFVGTDSFSFAASDGIASSEPVSVALNVTNNAPVVGSDRSYVLGKGQPISGIDFLAGASDADQDWLSADIVDQPDHGTLGYDWMSNTYTYYPEYGFTGLDKITYRIWDGAQYSDVATATLSVVAPSVTLTVETLSASLLRISGRVAGYHAANAFVELHGVANLSATADEDGFFTAETSNFALGELAAYAWTADGIQSDTASVAVAAPTPQFSAFTATNNGDNAWTIHGHVNDVLGQLLPVTFSGISSVAAKQAHLDVLGNFTLDVELADNEGGLLYASICDRWGRTGEASLEVQVG